MNNNKWRSPDEEWNATFCETLKTKTKFFMATKSAFGDFLLNMLSGALETIGESKLDEVLQNLHDTNPTDYQAAIFGGHALVKALLPVTAGTKTKIDDAIIKALDEAINASAAANGVTFP